MFWSLELTIELMSVLEQSGKYVLTLRRTFYGCFHCPPGFSTQLSPGRVISFLLHNVCSFPSRLCIQMWNAVLEEPCDLLSTYQEPRLAEIGVGRVP